MRRFSYDEALQTIASSERLMKSLGAHPTSGLYLTSEMITNAQEEELIEWRAMVHSEIETIERDVLLTLEPDKKNGV